MDLVLPGPVSYDEGDQLRVSIGGVVESLSEIETRATGRWSESHATVAQIYRIEIQSTVMKALALLRTIQPLAPYVGGKRAQDLKQQIDGATEVAASYRDDPTVNGQHAMSTAVVDAIRNAFDLVLLGSSINEARQRSFEIVDEARKTFDARLGEFTTSMNSLPSEFRQEVEKTTSGLRDESERLLEQLSARGRKIVAQARKDVALALLQDAQAQFAGAQRWLNSQVAIWATSQVSQPRPSCGLLTYL